MEKIIRLLNIQEFTFFSSNPSSSKLPTFSFAHTFGWYTLFRAYISKSLILRLSSVKIVQFFVTIYGHRPDQCTCTQ